MAIFDLEKSVQNLVEKVFDYEYEGKSISEWIKQIKNFKDIEREIASKIIREIRNAIFAHGTKYAMKELAKIEKEYIGE